MAVGHKMDLVFTALMLHLTFTDWLAVKRDIKKARTGSLVMLSVAVLALTLSLPPPPTS